MTRAIRPAVPVIPGPDGARRILAENNAMRCDACWTVGHDTVMERHADFYLILCTDWRACNERWRNAG